MPLALALDRLCDVVEALTPVEQPRVGFTCIDDDQGEGLGLAEAGPGYDRRFELLLDSVADDGEAGPTGGRQRASLRLRVRYSADGSRRAADARMGQDFHAIRKGLLVPTGWQSVTTGIDSIDPPASFSVEDIVAAQGDGPVARIMTIPVTVRYHEEV
jgi:hypothetical protein